MGTAPLSSSKMKFLLTVLSLLLSTTTSAPSADLDPEDNDTLDEFLEHFKQLSPTDQIEKKRREEALKENEDLVKEENKEYKEGKKTWFSALNEFSDLTKDQFEKEKTGLKRVNGTSFGRGLLRPEGGSKVDPASERYFASFRAAMAMNRDSVPTSYSSVDEGLATPVRSQQTCGSCVAFSNMAVIEICFAKTAGVLADYSEQQLLDCGYGQNDASGCDGAQLYSYAKTVADSSMSLTAEATYPYANTVQSCSDAAAYNMKDQVTTEIYTYNGDEETMK